MLQGVDNFAISEAIYTHDRILDEAFKYGDVVPIIHHIDQFAHAMAMVVEAGRIVDQPCGMMGAGRVFCR
jgi:hypothetical protein